MKHITEVTVYTNGPASEFKTWSNVPYFFTEALREHGIKVNLVDINPYPFIERGYNLTLRLVWKLFHRRTTYTYFRSGLRHWITGNHVQKALLQYPNSQADVFLTFSFSADKRSSRPVVLLSDWPYRYAIEYFRNRQPDRLESSSIARETIHIEEANLVISLFRSATDFMRENYRNRNIHYIGQAINVPSSVVSENEALPESKGGSFNLLFIGDAKYEAGLQVLMKAYEILKKSYPQLTLTLIGHDTSNLVQLPDGVISYGYLDKGQEASRKLFYSLLKRARIYVNSTPKWGGYSSILEALYFYTPVVVAPFHEAIQMFGEQSDFMIYCEENTPDILAARIKILLDDPGFPTISQRAHDAVKDLSWTSYTSRLLSLIESSFL